MQAYTAGEKDKSESAPKGRANYHIVSELIFKFRFKALEERGITTPISS